MSLNVRSLTGGIAGGIAGGLAFGILMTAMDMMGMVAGLAGSSSIVVGWLIHLVVSAAFGLGFAIVLGALVTGVGRALGFGAVFGVVAWIAGALVAMPLMMGMPVLQLGETQLMSLMGHVVYGIITGLVYQRLAHVDERSLDRV